MIFLTFPLMLAALIPVILLEVWIAKPLLGTSYGKTTWVIAVANVASTIVGIPAAWVAMFGLELLAGTTISRLVPQKFSEGPVINAVYLILSSAWLAPGSGLYWAVPVAAMVLLIPSFFASWYIEIFIIDKMVEGDWATIRSTGFKANAVSYAFLVLAGCGWLVFSIFKYRGH